MTFSRKLQKCWLMTKYDKKCLIVLGGNFYNKNQQEQFEGEEFYLEEEIWQGFKSNVKNFFNYCGEDLEKFFQVNETICLESKKSKEEDEEKIESYEISKEFIKGEFLTEAENVDKNIVFFGNSYNPRIIILDLKNRKVSNLKVKYPLILFEFQKACRISTKSFLLAGGLNTVNNMTKNCYAYNIDNHSAKKLNKMNIGRISFSFIFHNNFAYALGFFLY